MQVGPFKKNLNPIHHEKNDLYACFPKLKL